MSSLKSPFQQPELLDIHEPPMLLATVRHSPSKRNPHLSITRSDAMPSCSLDSPAIAETCTRKAG